MAHAKLSRVSKAALVASVAASAVLVSAGAAAAQQNAAPAATQQSSADAGEVIVTATRRQERLRDVPVAASVISADVLQERGGVSDPGVLLSGVSGVRFNNPGSPGTSELSIRGSGTARATSADSGVGLYRDGMYIGGGLQFGRTFLMTDLFDLDRAEILRGTLGALYGRNAVGGAINMITAKPIFRQAGYAYADYNNRLQGYQFQAVENMPLSDKVAVRLGVQTVDQYKGFFLNRTYNRYFDQTHGYDARAQIRYKDGPLDVTLTAERQEERIPPVVFQIAVPPTPPQFPKGYVVPTYAYDSNVPGLADLDARDLILRGSYDLHWSTFEFTAGYRDRSGDSYTDSDGFTPATLAATRAAGNPATTTDPNVNQAAIDHTQIYNAEGHLSGQVGAFRWLVGADLLRETSDFRLDVTRTPTAANTSTGSSRYSTQVWTSNAVYGSLAYQLTDKLTLTGEIRYTEDEKKAGQYTGDLVTQVVSIPLIVRDTSFPNTSWNAVASYHVTPTILFYGKVGTGYRVGGFNASNGDPRQPIPVPLSYDDEQSTTYEAGIKGNPIRPLYLSLVVYRTHVSGALVQETNGCALGNAVCPVQPTNFVTNAGTENITGFELEGNYRQQFLGGQLTAGANASRQYGRFTSGPVIGVKVPQTPNWIASSNVDYRHPFWNRTTLFGNVNYTGQWGGLQDVTTPPFRIDDRQIIDLRAGLDIGKLEVAAYLKNMTNDHYLLFKAATTNRWSGDGKNYGVQLRYTW